MIASNMVFSGDAHRPDIYALSVLEVHTEPVDQHVTLEVINILLIAHYPMSHAWLTENGLGCVKGEEMSCSRKISSIRCSNISMPQEIHKKNILLMSASQETTNDSQKSKSVL